MVWGGEVAGEFASVKAVNVFVESFSSNDSKNIPLKLTVALDKTNRILAKDISTNPNFRGMGTTLIAVHVDSKGLNWISVGDSILYLYRSKKLHRLNDDHSMLPVLQEAVRCGKITHEEAMVHPQRNALRSALTGEDIPIVDLREESYQLNKDDLILLSTDGILTLTESEISAVLERYKNQSANVIASQLLNAVAQVNKPRQDNTLVEVIKFSGSSRSSLKSTGIITVISILVIVAVLAFGPLEKIGLSKFSNKPEVTIAPKTEKEVVTPVSINDSMSVTPVPISAQPPSISVAGEPTAAGPRLPNKNPEQGKPVVKKIDTLTKSATSDKNKAPDKVATPPKNLAPVNDVKPAAINNSPPTTSGSAPAQQPPISSPSAASNKNQNPDPSESANKKINTSAQSDEASPKVPNSNVQPADKPVSSEPAKRSDNLIILSPKSGYTPKDNGEKPRELLNTDHTQDKKLELNRKE